MKSKMKAFVCRGPKQFSLEDVEIGEPEIGEVKLRVLYAGICGSDLSIVHGRNPFASYPLIPGHEFVGEVVESKDASFQAGQLAAVMPVVGCGECESCQLGNVNRCRKVKLYGVHMNGGFAEYVLVKAKNLIPFEEPIQPSQVVFSEPLAVGVHANRINGTNPKDSIAIIGGGIIGSVILKGAKVLGAKSITVIDVIAERLERSLLLGAQDVINSSQHDLRELSKNQHYVGRYDSVFDVVGNDETLDIALDLLKPAGKLVLVAVPSGEKRNIDVLKIFSQEKVLTASRTYSREDFVRALELITTHQVYPSDFITHEYPFSSIDFALDRAENSKNEELKVIVKM